MGSLCVRFLPLWQELEDLAFAHLPSLLATDAPLLFPPAQVPHTDAASPLALRTPTVV